MLVCRYLNDSQSGLPCATHTVSPSVTVCWPVDNICLASGAHTMVSAQAYDTDTVTALQEYINGQLSCSADVASFQQKYAPQPGVYNYVTRAWDNSGRDFVSGRTITAYDGNPGFIPARPAAVSVRPPSACRKAPTAATRSRFSAIAGWRMCPPRSSASMAISS